jgi:AcrR family transcriptional regulator
MPGAPPQSGPRERILQEARRLFHERGYAETSIADIRAAAGVSSSSLYHQFHTKDDLLVAVLASYHAALDAVVIGPAFASTADPVERIFALLRCHRDRIDAGQCRHGCPIGNLALEVGPAQPEARELVAAIFAKWTGAVRGCLDAVADRLPPGTDTARLASFVLTTMEGAVMQSVTLGSIGPFDDAIAELRTYLDCLVQPPPEKGP